MYTLYNEHFVMADDELDFIKTITNNRKSYTEIFYAAFDISFGDANNFEKLIKKLRNAPPRSFSGNVVRYFYDYQGKILLDLEKKYAEPLDKQGIDVVSLFLADRSEIHIAPQSGDEARIYFRLGGDSLSQLGQRYAELKDALLGLIQQYSEV